MNIQDIIGNIPEHLKKVVDCKYLENENGCSHVMNPGGCDDSECCMVAIRRRDDNFENIKPCGLLIGELCNSLNSSFAGCGSPYCIHFKTENWRGRK